MPNWLGAFLDIVNIFKEKDYEIEKNRLLKRRFCFSNLVYLL